MTICFLFQRWAKCIAIHLYKVILKGPNHSIILPHDQKIQLWIYLVLAKNPYSIPLLPVITILNYNDTLRMISTLKTLPITKQAWCFHSIKTLLEVMNDCLNILGLN